MNITETPVLSQPSIAHETPRKSKSGGAKPIGRTCHGCVVLHVRITRSEQEALKALAAERGMSIGGLLRAVITDMLAKKHTR